MIVQTSALRRSVVAAVVGLAPAAAPGVNIIWTGGFAGDFQTPGNWATGAVPSLPDTAIFNSAFLMTVDLSADASIARVLHSAGDLVLNLNTHTLTLGRPGSADPSWSSGTADPTRGDVTIRDGTLRANFVTLADSFEDRSVITLDGAATTFEAQDSMRVGAFGDGGLVAKDGAFLSVGNDIIIGETPFGDGLLSLMGAGSTANVVDQVQVGALGRGTLRAMAGTTLTSDDLFVAAFEFSSGDVFISGTNAVVSTTNAAVGFAGSGLMNIITGGRFSAIQLRVGQSPGSDGQILVRDPGSELSVFGETAVGLSGDGEILARLGANVSLGTLLITTGNQVATVTVEDAATLFDVSGEITIGNIGTGLFDLRNDALVTAGSVTVGGAGLLRLDNATLSAPTITVNGFGIGGPRGLLADTGIVGEGSLIGNVTNFGRIRPSPEFATITIDGAYTQDNSGLLLLGLLVPTFSGPQLGTLAVTGDVVIDGEVRFEPDNNTINPTLGQRIPFITGATSVAGAFDDADLPDPVNTDLRFIIDVTPDSVDLVATTFGDVDGDLTVDASDLAVLLAAWGSSSPNADFNNDGVVDAADLATLLAQWG